MKKIHGIRPNIPAVLITGYGELIAIEEIKSWGVDALLMKPFRLLDLSKVTRDLLSRETV